MSKRVLSVQSEICISQSLYICLHIFEKRKKSNHWDSKFSSLKVVNENKTKLSYYNDSANFHYKNEAEFKVYLTKHSACSKSSYSSFRILVIYASNCKKNIQNLRHLLGYVKFCFKSLQNESQNGAISFVGKFT